MIAYIVLGLAALGVGYSNVKTVFERRQYPPPGRLVDIGGYRLHVQCEGTKSPTVILGAGAGAWSFVMRRLQIGLRDSVRVCSYDRAGLGWSDAPALARDVGTSVDELHRLIAAAPLEQPIILVGHSLGANIAQVYAATYPNELAGAILLDPGQHNELMEDFKGGDSLAARINSCGWKCPAASAMARLGITRLTARSAGKKSLTKEEAKLYRLGLAKSSTVKTVLGVLAYLPKSALQIRAARDFGRVPVTIMYSEHTRLPEGKETSDSVAIWHAKTLDSMRVLVQGSARPRGPIIVPSVTHVTMVLDSSAVRMVVTEVMRMVHADSTTR